MSFEFRENGKAVIRIEGQAGGFVGQVREDLPWVESSLDPDFRQYILDFPRDQLPGIYSLIRHYQDSRSITVFHSRQEADDRLDRHFAGRPL